MASRVKLNHLMYVRYQHADINKARKFLIDFGFAIVKGAEGIIYYVVEIILKRNLFCITVKLRSPVFNCTNDVGVYLSGR